MTDVTDVKGPIQIPLNSEDDILAELLLIDQHGVKAHSRWHREENCAFCYDTLKDQYVFQYPCDPDHVYHRNCLLMNVIVYKRLHCPLCNVYPTAKMGTAHLAPEA